MTYSLSMRKGLLIQGPINSPGFGPYSFDRSGNFKKYWIDYNTISNISNLVSSGLDLFDEIVISTWDSEENRRLLTQFSSTKRITCIFVNEDQNLKELTQLGTHKYHQIKTMHEGALILEQLDCEAIVKIRTDQNLDLKELSRLCEQHKFKNPYSLGVPYVNLFEIDRLTDFYFLGRAKTVVGVCNSYLHSPETFDDTHKDYFRKFSNYLIAAFNGSGLGDKSTLSNDAKYRSVLAWTHCFYPLSASLHRNFYWRGEKVNNQLNSWLRWYFVFHARGSRGVRIKFVLNLVLLSIIRCFIKPTIKPSSYLKYRYFRLKARSILD